MVETTAESMAEPTDPPMVQQMAESTACHSGCRWATRMDMQLADSTVAMWAHNWAVQTEQSRD